MPIAINGTGTITGISAGGLPDAIITGAELDGAQTGSAPIYGARAWVNFNGTGTVAIRASGNVTSITDNGTGDYTVNFTTAMPDANYGFVFGAEIVGGAGNAKGVIGNWSTAPTTSSLRIASFADSFSVFTDNPRITVAIFR
jgi:hypothetical protein